MKLDSLLAALPAYTLSGAPDIEISGVVADSRRVEPGNLFVAIRGLENDGHAYISQALERGARAVALQDPVFFPVPQSSATLATILVPDSRQALAWLAAAWYGYPARALRMVGVTGTDGKTTTVVLIYHILSAAGYKAGMISTVNAIIGQRTYDTGLHTTTPDSPDVQCYLAEMVSTGSDYAVLEATSHGLAQGRVTACEFDVAVVTNITHEHLDYHGSSQAYREAKARLFRELSGAWRKPGALKVAVLNHDDTSYSYLREIPADLQLTYGLTEEALITAAGVRNTPDGLAFSVVTPQGRFPICSSLIGLYNVSNILAAVAVAVSQGIGPTAIAEGIASVKSIPGRMERIDCGQAFTAIVDFAHTPFALRRALEAARALAQGRVITVFGCAGLRDVAKRPMMGQIAAELADYTILTAEDPRTEDLEAIMAQIATGCQQVGGKEGNTYERIADRGEAIMRAVSLARPGDVVIVCGKGHERSLCFGTTEYPWDDREALAMALTGNPLRTLPTASR
jgi:UDP-N-acetylmuramoyl-L-alanyl-D-glutamate--2,6-diaminopimelate ligase